MEPKPASSRLLRQGFLATPMLLALLFAPANLGAENLPAQTHAAQAAKPEQQPNTAKPVPEATATQPPASSAPVDHANQPINQAKVSWDSRGLEIEASNSSLRQILRQVAAATGGKLEGLSQDQRVFGNYGPGPERDVLLQLLDGSGYNVLMMGGRGTDAPLEIVLSPRSPVSPQTQIHGNPTEAQATDPDPDPDPDPTEAPRPDTNQSPFANGEPVKDQAQFVQEILDRQHKIDVQQEQQQQDQQTDPQ
jgi:hypothetical protein